MYEGNDGLKIADQERGEVMGEKQIKRYDIEPHDFGEGGCSVSMMEDPDGDYIEFCDHELVQAERDMLRSAINKSHACYACPEMMDNSKLRAENAKLR